VVEMAKSAETKRRESERNVPKAMQSPLNKPLKEEETMARQSTMDHIHELLADIDAQGLELDDTRDSENDIPITEELRDDRHEEANDQNDDEQQHNEVDDQPGRLSLFQDSRTKPGYLVSAEFTRPRHSAVSSGPMPQTNTVTKAVLPRRGSATEHDYGYPKVHEAYKRYKEQMGMNCGKPQQLVFFAKSANLGGVNYTSSKKYFAARKSTVMDRVGPLVGPPHGSAGAMDQKRARYQKRNSLRRHHAVVNRRPPPPYAAPRSPPQPMITMNGGVTHKPTTTPSRKKFTFGTVEAEEETKESAHDVSYGLDLRWSTLDVGSPRLVGRGSSREKSVEMMEIDEDADDVVLSPLDDALPTLPSNAYSSPAANGQYQSTTAATPGVIRSSPNVAVSTYWSALSRQGLNIDSLKANDIKLK